MLKLEQLGKHYGDFQDVNNLTLSVKAGEMFGFLGTNGAGKTTTIRMLMGILVPSTGVVTIDSKDAHKDRVEVNKVIGYLPDAPIFYDFLRGREILQFVGEMHGQSAA